jgi:HPt (histidine-containing phosphotransfer) domain-containing protein
VSFIIYGKISFQNPKHQRKKVMETTKLPENMGVDVEDFKELFKLYMETTSSDLEQLKTALNAGDAENVHEKAHSIKGASGSLGLNELYETAKAIDDRARVNSLNGLENMVQAFSEKYQKLVEEFEKGN